MIDGFLQDLRHGARMLVKNPGFTLVAIASIAIGVGANAAMFSLADGLVLRPLQVPRAGEIVAVSAIAPRANESFTSNRLLSYPDYVDLRDRAQSFDGLLAYSVTVASFATSRDQPAQSRLGLVVSGNFFDVLQLQPALGRFFRPDEDQVPGRDAVIVLAHETWADQFGSDPGVVGRQMRLARTRLHGHRGRAGELLGDASCPSAGLLRSDRDVAAADRVAAGGAPAAETRAVSMFVAGSSPASRSNRHERRRRSSPARSRSRIRIRIATTDCWCGPRSTPGWKSAAHRRRARSCS